MPYAKGGTILLLLDAVVGECALVLELLARKDEPLLVGQDALLVMDLALHHVDGIARLHLEDDGFVRRVLTRKWNGRCFAGKICKRMA